MGSGARRTQHVGSVGRSDVVSKVGRNTVTSGGPVTVTVTEPIPCYRSREGLFYVCLASGNQRRSCYRSSLCYRSKKNYAQPWW